MSLKVEALVNGNLMEVPAFESVMINLWGLLTGTAMVVVSNDIHKVVNLINDIMKSLVGWLAGYLRL